MTPLPRLLSVVLFAAIGANFSSALAQKKDEKKASKAMSQEAKRGKYLAQIAGCNDCHTPGYMASAGNVEESVWLTGVPPMRRT